MIWGGTDRFFWSGIYTASNTSARHEGGLNLLYLRWPHRVANRGVGGQPMVQHRGGERAGLRLGLYLPVASASEAGNLPGCGQRFGQLFQLLCPRPGQVWPAAAPSTAKLRRVAATILPACLPACTSRGVTETKQRHFASADTAQHHNRTRQLGLSRSMMARNKSAFASVSTDGN